VVAEKNRVSALMARAAYHRTTSRDYEFSGGLLTFCVQSGISRAYEIVERRRHKVGQTQAIAAVARITG
jgi:hypothetical protein